jgi:L-fucose isomerase-like protein
VANVDDLQGLLRYICRNGFEHHVALTMGHVAAILEEALTTYKNWDVYRHLGKGVSATS